MLKYILVYIISIWLISAIVTVYDKSCAKKGKWRVRESVLLFLGFVGGAGGMFLTMQIIRHKTKKMKFMLLLPLFIVLHIILFIVYFYYAI